MQQEWYWDIKTHREEYRGCIIDAWWLYISAWRIKVHSYVSYNERQVFTRKSVLTILCENPWCHIGSSIDTFWWRSRDTKTCDGLWDVFSGSFLSIRQTEMGSGQEMIRIWNWWMGALTSKWKIIGGLLLILLKKSAWSRLRPGERARIAA